MELKLTKRPKSPIIIHGFPGIGLVGAIASNYLIEHLNAEPIGNIESKKIMPLAAIHNSQIVEPLGIYYDKVHNLVLFRITTNLNGLEWYAAEMIAKLAKELNAKEIISLEGIAVQESIEEPNAYFFSQDAKKDKLFEKIGVKKIREGVILGATGALLLNPDLPITCILSETHSNMPDSRAAAKIIEVLDAYLNLNVDPKPLVQKAEEMESKLKEIMSKSQQAVDLKERKDLDYFG